MDGFCRCDPATKIRGRRGTSCPDEPDACGLEDRVEGAVELFVAVVEQEPRLLAAVVEIHQQVAGLYIIHAETGLRVQATYSILRVAIETKNSTYSRRSQTVSTVKGRTQGSCCVLERPADGEVDERYEQAASKDGSADATRAPSLWVAKTRPALREIADLQAGR
jgi:hypothetical protein